MTLIAPIHRNRTQSYRQEKIDFFMKDESNPSCLTNYSMLQDLIEQANEYICIAANTDLHIDILEIISTSKKKDVRLYMVLQSFEKSKKTLNYFNHKNPSLLRQVSHLSNNFVITEHQSLLFVNPLSEEKNIGLRLNDEHRSDLYYIFNDYFWNQASKEKFLDDVRDPESPYPPFERKLQYVCINKEVFKDYDACVVPRDEKYAKFKLNGLPFYCSDDICSVMTIQDKTLHIGALQINTDIFEYIGGLWTLETNTLENIDSSLSIIPFKESWNSTLPIQEEVQKKLVSVESESIEKMINTEAKYFPSVPYTKSIQYSWEVMPPKKTKGAKQAAIYNELKAVKSKFKEDCKVLERILDEVRKIKSPWLSFFQGHRHKSKAYEAQLEKYIQCDLETYKIVELTDFLTSDFKIYFHDVLSFSGIYKEDLSKKEQEEVWKKEKKDKENALRKKEDALISLQEAIKDNCDFQEKVRQLTREINNLEQASKENKSALELTRKERDEDQAKTTSDKAQRKEKGKLERDIKSLMQDIESTYTRFHYKPKTNELSYLKKDIKVLWSNYRLPKYTLPDIGELFEDKSQYYLEITQYEDLERANELAKNRYLKKDQKAKVTVKDLE